MVSQLSNYLAGHGIEVSVLTPETVENGTPPNGRLRKFPVLFAGKIWRYPIGMRADLAKLANLAGLVFHIHGVWMAPQWLAARVLSRKGAPTILSPHNMLNSWLWNNGLARSVKKRIYWHLLAAPAFHGISVIHAITPLEREQLAPYFPGKHLEVIANGIDLEEVDQYIGAIKARPELEFPFILFLGRLHPVKGIELLIAAYAKSVKSYPFRLLIAGPESSRAYGLKLKTMIRSLGVEKQVTFLGPVSGQEKWNLYRQAWAVCNPSHTEVLGLVNLEAAVTGTPVITTTNTGLVDWPDAGGILVHPQVEELAQALSQVFSWTEGERRDRGQRLRRLVECRYSWKAIGPQWLELYSSLL